MIAPWNLKQKKVSSGAAPIASMGAGGLRRECSENSLITSLLPHQWFSVKVQEYLLLQTAGQKGIVGLGVWISLTGIGLERFPRVQSPRNPFGIK